MVGGGSLRFIFLHIYETNRVIRGADLGDIIWL